MNNADSSFLFLNDIDLDLETRRKVSQLLDYTVKGRSDVFVTPIGADTKPSELLREFDEVFNSSSADINPILMKLELDNREKFGPRSISKSWKDRKQSLLDSFKSDNLCSVEITPISGSGRLRPISITKASKLLKTNTNSGLPYFIKKGLVKERVVNKFDNLLERKDPCVLFTRTQEQNKTRNIWGYPIADTLNEMMYYSPLLSIQKQLSYRAALNGPLSVDQALTKLIYKVSRGTVLVSVDFVAFDNSAKFKLQKTAFDYIKSCFQSIYASAIDVIFRRFNAIGIVTPDGVKDGEHGIPSGSTFTNEVGSICQVNMAKTLPWIGFDFQVQGDDGVYLVPKSKLDEFFKAFKDCGVDLNITKSYISDKYCIYLQNLHHVDYKHDGLIRGIYPVYRALNRIIHQERWSDFEDYGIVGKDFYSIRTICILENCRYHPLFKDLVKFILSKDKYSLAYSEQGLNGYVQMLSKTEGGGEILNHQYGDDVSGINNFETVKLIRELG